MGEPRRGLDFSQELAERGWYHSFELPDGTRIQGYSTAAANRMLIGANVRRDKRKLVVDKIAATHILQAHLDRAASDLRAREPRP